MTKQIVTQKSFSQFVESPGMFLTWYSLSLKGAAPSVHSSLTQTAKRYLKRYSELLNSYREAKAISFLSPVRRFKAILKARESLMFFLSQFFNWIVKSLGVVITGAR
ncbi:hypothetical protein [Gilvimarinus chinensis]|uniref:hypothetical protein n=1 Tax=Gilvimarinus chinensis TaxID=396005 RepID=UPI0012FAF87D|nr:hypothetical protein [Gilvimarinus chinensis]